MIGVDRLLAEECGLEDLAFCLNDDVIRAEGCGPLYREVDSAWCSVDSSTSVCCGLEESDCCELNVLLIVLIAVGAVVLIGVCCFCCCRRCRRNRAQRFVKQPGRQDDTVYDDNNASDADNPSAAHINDKANKLDNRKKSAKNLPTVQEQSFDSYHKPSAAGLAMVALSKSSTLYDEYSMDDSALVQQGMLPSRGEKGYDI